MRIILSEILFLLFLFLGYTTKQNAVHAEISANKYLFTEGEKPTKKTPFNEVEKFPWADSVLASLSLEEKLGQLFMVAAYSNKDASHEAELKSLIKNQNLGGLIFFQGGPGRQAHMCNRLQAASKIPMLIGMDAEWGLDMRLDSTIGYPREMTLGALSDQDLIYQMGAQVAQQCKDMGVHVNFAPVIDVNNNPNNPVINSRAFGEDVERVTNGGLQYMKGMQDNGVMACAKHFPGHGDTDSDSHKTLPIVNHTKERLNALELVPFKKLFNKGVASVMVAHLYIPKLDNTPNRASTLSPEIVTKLLKEELNYKGLIFTDALNMNGVAKYYGPGEVDALAFAAGNDVLLFAEDVPKAISLIKTEIDSGNIAIERVNESCLKILQYKEWCGLNKYKPINTKGLYERLNKSSYTLLNKQLKANAITVAKDNGLLPLNTQTKRTALIDVGGNTQSVFAQNIAAYGSIDILPLSSDGTKLPTFMQALDIYDQIIISVTETNNSVRRNFGLANDDVAFINKLAKRKDIVLMHFGNPYALSKINSNALQAIVVGYQDDETTQQVGAEAIMGKRLLSGILPVSISQFLPAGTQIIKRPNTDVFYDENLAMADSKAWQKVDSLIDLGLAKKAYPGCQVLALKNGKIIYERNVGRFTYDENSPKVTPASIYDLASLTKVLSTTLSAMKLYDDGKLELTKTFGDYLSWLPAESAVAKVKIQDAMLHQSGLPGWIPFYKEINEHPEWEGYLVSKTQTDAFSIPVSAHYFASPSLRDTLFKRIADVSLGRKEYKYSDLGFYLLKEVIETITNTPINKFVADNFYRKMSLGTLGYLPLERYTVDEIAPTEYDTYWRNELVHGYVHDQGAALLGGVGGHAGLFGNAIDVAAIMQMLLNGGTFAGETLLKSSTIKLFTQTVEKPSENRRGLGFDKPVRDGGPGPTFKGISFKSFGHSGFTGTLAWADPETEIVYVFLSNRVYPTAENKKLIKMNLRSDIHETLYRVLQGK